MVSLWSALSITTAVALLVMTVNRAVAAEDDVGAFRRGWARARRVRLRSPVALAPA